MEYSGEILRLHWLIDEQPVVEVKSYRNSIKMTLTRFVKGPRHFLEDFAAVRISFGQSENEEVKYLSLIRQPMLT